MASRNPDQTELTDELSEKFASRHPIRPCPEAPSGFEFGGYVWDEKELPSRHQPQEETSDAAAETSDIKS